VLFDGKRPEQPDARCDGIRVAEDVDEVGEVQQGGRHADRGERAKDRAGRREDERRDDHDVHRRKDAESPTQVEISETDASVVFEFTPQQGGDEEAGQEEEHCHASTGSHRQGQAGVCREDGQYGQRAQSVERWDTESG